jgi:hypothetical protein
VQKRDNPADTRSGNATAVSLGNNAALPLLMASLSQGSTPWLRCLQSAGVLRAHPVCGAKRPNPPPSADAGKRKTFWGSMFDETVAYPLTRDVGALHGQL